MTEPEPVIEPVEQVEEWRHFHPLSPLVKGGIALVAVIGYFVSQQVDRLLGQSRGDDPTAGHLGLVIGGIAVVLVAIVLGAWISWRFSKFRLTPTLVEVRHGWVFRQHRQVRFDRIQAVDVSRPILARLTGLSEVVVQSAGGTESHLKLSFLAQAEALRLRDQLASLSAQGLRSQSVHGAPREVGSGADAEGSPGSGQPPVDANAVAPVEVVRVPTARVVQSWLYSPATVVLLAAIVVLVTGFATGSKGLIGTAAPVLLGAGGHKFGELVSSLNFVLEQTPAALRVRYGITELKATTIPIHRIQAVEVAQPLWWRPVGWWRVRVNVAGVGQGLEADSESRLLPVGTLEEALGIVTLALGRHDGELLHRAALGTGPDGGFTTAPRSARVLDPFAWRRRGYAVDERLLVIRSGFFARSIQLVPHARVQSITAAQGPVQRRLDLASVRVISTPGAVVPIVHHLALRTAEQLVADQRARSTSARISA